MVEPREDDFMLAYQDSCASSTLLLIHGFPLNSNLWEPQMDDLRDVARMLAMEQHQVQSGITSRSPGTRSSAAQTSAFPPSEVRSRVVAASAS